MPLFSLPVPQNLDDCEYNPGDEHEESDGDDLADDWDAEKTTRRASKGSRNRTTLLIADAPVTLRQYQDNLKGKVEQLFSHSPCETAEEEETEGEGEGPTRSSIAMTEDWVKVQDRCVRLYIITSLRVFFLVEVWMLMLYGIVHTKTV